MLNNKYAPNLIKRSPEKGVEFVFETDFFTTKQLTHKERERHFKSCYIMLKSINQGESCPIVTKNDASTSGRAD